MIRTIREAAATVAIATGAIALVVGLLVAMVVLGDDP